MGEAASTLRLRHGPAPRGDHTLASGPGCSVGQVWLQLGPGGLGPVQTLPQTCQQREGLGAPWDHPTTAWHTVWLSPFQM